MSNKDFSKIKSNSEPGVDIAVLQSSTNESDQQHLPGERTTEPLRAKDIMKDGVHTVKRTTPIYQAISTLVGRRLSSVPVVDDNMGLVGIVSEKDVLELLYDKDLKGGTVEDFMAGEVVSFDAEDTLADICDCFVNNHFRNVAILKEDKLASVISRLDIIDANKDKFQRHNLSENASQRDVFNARDVMSYGLFTAKRQTPLYEAVEILLKRHVTGLPVVDDYMSLEGIITEKDILKVLYKPEATAEKVGDLMTAELTTFDCNDSLFDICDCLINNSFRRVMILAHGKLTGIISRTDIIEFILKHKTDIDKQKPMD